MFRKRCQIFKRKPKEVLFIIAASSLLFLIACGEGGETVDEVPLHTGEEATQLDDFYSEPAANRVLNIGFEGGLCQIAIVLAHLRGFFEGEGLETQIVVTGDMVSSRDALAAGHIDTTAGMLAGWFVPVTQGVEMEFTLGLHTGCASAFVLANSDIMHFEAGQDIAVSGAIGGAFHNIGLRFIYREGLVPSDFTWRDFSADQAVMALESGDVQVAVIPDQVGQQFVEQGLLRRIRSLDDADFTDEPCCVLGISRAFLAENPKTSERITKAIYDATRWLGESEANKVEAVELLIEAGYLSANLDVEYIVSLLQNWTWGVTHEQTELTLQASIREFQNLGLLNENLDPDVVQSEIWNPLGETGCCPNANES